MLGCLLKPGELPLLPTEFVETAEEKIDESKCTLFFQRVIIQESKLWCHRGKAPLNENGAFGNGAQTRLYGCIGQMILAWPSYWAVRGKLEWVVQQWRLIITLVYAICTEAICVAYQCKIVCLQRKSSQAHAGVAMARSILLPVGSGRASFIARMGLMRATSLETIVSRAKTLDQSGAHLIAVVTSFPLPFHSSASGQLRRASETAERGKEQRKLLFPLRQVAWAAVTLEAGTTVVKVKYLR